MIFGLDPRSMSNFTLVRPVLHRLAGRVIEISLGIAIPTPVTHREHTTNIQPLEGFGNEIKFDTLVDSVDTAHVDTDTVYEYTVAVLQINTTAHGLVHPLRVIQVQVSCQELGTETITQLCREHLLVYCIRVGQVTCS